MQIKTPSRLHITLIDLNGSYGRIDGGIGLTLADPGFILEAVPGDTQTTIEFAETAGGSKEERTACQTKLLAAAEKAAAHYAPGTGYHLTVHQLYPSHSGLGSGTQMALAAAKLIAELNDRHPQSIELAEITGRGGTSGIGVHAFDHGGFIADGGHSKKEKSSFMPSSVSTAKPACLIGRYHFPDDWGVLLAIPAFGNRYNGAAETNIFQTHCPVPKTDVEQVSHHSTRSRPSASTKSSSPSSPPNSPNSKTTCGTQEHTASVSAPSAQPSSPSMTGQTRTSSPQPKNSSAKTAQSSPPAPKTTAQNSHSKKEKLTAQYICLQKKVEVHIT